MTFDIDAGGDGRLTVRCDTADLRLYMLEGDSAYDVVRQFLGVIGQSFLPPLWAFGYGQSRWGYKTERDVSRVAARHQAAGVPLDYVCLDIDYMDRYIDFTVNRRRFPDMAGYTAELRKKGLHLVPIVDAGIKIEPGNPVYDEGVKRGYFCKNREGGDFQAEVWPGMTHFPDFTRAEVRTWFGEQYKVYTEMGLEGFWNDMNEPAIFSSEYRAQTDKLDAVRGDPDQPERHIADFKDFFHRLDDGRVKSNYEVHNMFGAMMTRASGEGLERLLDRRYLRSPARPTLGPTGTAGYGRGTTPPPGRCCGRTCTTCRPSTCAAFCSAARIPAASAATPPGSCCCGGWPCRCSRPSCAITPLSSPGTRSATGSGMWRTSAR